MVWRGDRILNLYFAGWGSKDADAYLRTKKAHRLLSQANEKRVIEGWVEDGLSDRLFIDSGAFTVAHSGAELDIDDYISYIESYPDIKNWAELDVIPYPVLNAETAKSCSQASWDNYLYMKSVDQLGKTTIVKKRLVDETEKV